MFFLNLLGEASLPLTLPPPLPAAPPPPAPESEVCYDSSTSGQICEDITHYAQVVPPMLAIFLLIGNVMLLNLLIAVFR